MGLFDGLMDAFGGQTPAGSGSVAQATGSYNSATGNAGNQTTAGNTAMGYWGPANAQYFQSGNQLAQQLLRTPNQQDQANVLGNEGADAATVYAKARARLMSDAASRGIDTSGNAGAQSSELAGGLNGLNQAYTNQLASNATNYYNQYLSPEATQQREAEANDIYDKMAGTAWNEGQDALNSANKTYLAAGSGYADLGKMQDEEQQQQNSLWDGLLGNFGGGIGKLVANGVGGGGGNRGSSAQGMSIPELQMLALQMGGVMP